MSQPARKIATYEDLVAAPDGLRAEILNGDLHLTPRPAKPHNASQSEMGIDLGGTFSRRRGGGPGGWVFRDDPELWLGRPDPRSEVAVPDMAAWRRERFAPGDTHGFTLVPDWICEVLSPGSRNARRDRLIKMEVYHRAEVPWYWIVDPAARTIEVFERQDKGYLVAAHASGTADATLPPFDAVPLPIGNWWTTTDDDEDQAHR